ncbi:MAG: MFS transporter [Betaproteobacteria bacterium]|nr:MFS transporter [Betaproteobacteria bacterium]
MPVHHSTLRLSAYGLLGLPLAMAALPLYVHLPKFYGDDLGMPLALLGTILLVTRLGDAVIDPLLGFLSDRAGNRVRLVVASLPLIAGGMVALFHPPTESAHQPIWLAAALIVTYLGFSMASIAYQSWGAQLSTDAHERTRITAAREAFTLIGVLIAAAAPQLLGGENAQGLGRFSLAFVALVAVCGAVTLGTSPRPAPRRTDSSGVWQAITQPFANRDFRVLLVVFVLSGVAAAIPSTLVLFYIQDVLRAPGASAVFLVLYFLAGAAGMPFWVWLARRMGKKQAWVTSMLLAVGAFVWAYVLGPGDVAAFGLICVLSGMALGADLALPPSILADVIDRDARTRAGTAAEGSYFGLWNLVTKANLAAAAGIALPALAWLGYQPGESGATGAVSLVYCLFPCAFKLAAVAGLSVWRAPAPIRGSLGLQGE